jgi:enoyl-CoA hydratase/carnithine racemase
MAPPSYTQISPPFKNIKLSQVAPSIALITLSRPGKHNAFTDQMELDLVRAFGVLDKDDSVKVIVVTGEGKMFCAGADLESSVSERVPGEGRKEHRDQLVNSLLFLPRVLVLAFEGAIF